MKKYSQKKNKILKYMQKKLHMSQDNFRVFVKCFPQLYSMKDLNPKISKMSKDKLETLLLILEEHIIFEYGDDNSLSKSLVGAVVDLAEDDSIDLKRRVRLLMSSIVAFQDVSGNRSIEKAKIQMPIKLFLKNFSIDELIFPVILTVQEIIENVKNEEIIGVFADKRELLEEIPLEIQENYDIIDKITMINSLGIKTTKLIISQRS